MEKFFKLADNATNVIGGGAGAACKTACGNKDINVIFSAVSNALIFLIGALAVIMIIIGALRYITSNGDPKQAEAARNTILYSVIGLILAIAAYAIVNFVVTTFNK